MAKETVGARVPEAIYDQVVEYAETHEITRTAAIELFLRKGLEDPDAFERERSYTVKIRPTSRFAREEPVVSGDWRAQLKAANLQVGDWENTKALTARMPRDVVRGIEEHAESQDLGKTVAAADLLKRGLWADPLPDGWVDPMVDDDSIEGDVQTVELEPEAADMFRRCRLEYRNTPSETVNLLVSATYSTHAVRIGWAKSDELPA